MYCEPVEGPSLPGVYRYDPSLPVCMNPDVIMYTASRFCMDKIYMGYNMMANDIDECT